MLINGVELNIAPNANLTGANLWGANLSCTNLMGANLEGANLWGANLMGAYLWGANLEGANLTGANLMGANLEGANLWGANLEGANLTGANLMGANLEGANLGGANLSCTCLIDGGQRSDGYRFVGWVRKSGLWIRAGCRSLSIAGAREHWTKTRGGTPLGDETMSVLDHIERAARARNLI